MPESGTIRPTLTSAGSSARATVDSPMAAAPESTVRRVTDVFDILLDILSWLIFVLPIGLLIDRLLHAEIGLADTVVGPQGLIVAFERNAAGLKDVAVIGGLERFRHALLDQQYCQIRLPADLDQPFEDEIRNRGRQAPRGFIQHQKFWRGRQSAADRQHLLLAAGQGSRELAAAFGKHRQPFEDTLDIVFPIAPAGLGHRAHFEIFHHRERWKDLASFGDMGDAKMGALRRPDGQEVGIFECDRAGACAYYSGNGLEKRGLAGTVRSDDGDELTPVDLDRDAVPNADCRIAGGQPFNAEHAPAIFCRDRPR